MEEDIKILENYLNYESTKRLLAPPEIIAIENLIAKNKELEELLDDRLWNEHIHKETDKMWRNKIKEKIEELVKEGNYRMKDNPIGRVHFMKEITDYKIEILQELLDE